MAEYEARLGELLQEGLLSFRPPVNPEKEPREYFIVIGQYVEALVNASITPEALALALQMIRRDRKDRFWPSIAELRPVCFDAMAILRTRVRDAQGRTALPKPAPAISPQERALVAEKMRLLAHHSRAGTLSDTSLEEIDAEARKAMKENAA